SPVEINAPGMHLLGQRAEQAKIAMRGVPKSRAFRRWVHVWNVGADGEMYSHRNPPLERRRKDAGFRVLRLDDAAVKKLSCRLPIANANALCQLGNFIQIFARLFGHAELAFPERGFNVLRSVPGKRNLKIVDERRAVHRD